MSLKGGQNCLFKIIIDRFSYAFSYFIPKVSVSVAQWIEHLHLE